MDIGIISIIGITIAAVTTVVGVVWKLSGWKHKMDGELDKMDGKLDKVNGKLDDLEPLRKNAGLLVSMITEIHKAVNEKLSREIHAHQLMDKKALDNSHIKHSAPDKPLSPPDEQNAPCCVSLPSKRRPAVPPPAGTEGKHFAA